MVHLSVSSLVIRIQNSDPHVRCTPIWFKEDTTVYAHADHRRQLDACHCNPWFRTEYHDWTLSQFTSSPDFFILRYVWRKYVLLDAEVCHGKFTEVTLYRSYTDSRSNRIFSIIVNHDILNVDHEWDGRTQKDQQSDGLSNTTTLSSPNDTKACCFFAFAGPTGRPSDSPLLMGLFARIWYGETKRICHSDKSDIDRSCRASRQCHSGKVTFRPTICNRSFWLLRTLLLDTVVSVGHLTPLSCRKSNLEIQIRDVYDVCPTQSDLTLIFTWNLELGACSSCSGDQKLSVQLPYSTL